GFDKSKDRLGIDGQIAMENAARNRQRKANCIVFRLAVKSRPQSRNLRDGTGESVKRGFPLFRPLCAPRRFAFLKTAAVRLFDSAGGVRFGLANPLFDSSFRAAPLIPGWDAMPGKIDSRKGERRPGDGLAGRPITRKNLRRHTARSQPLSG